MINNLYVEHVLITIIINTTKLRIPKSLLFKGHKRFLEFTGMKVNVSLKTDKQ